MSSKGIQQRTLDLVTRASDGGDYGISVIARIRQDGRWEGLLEFAAVGRGEPMRTDVQTTQASVDDVFNWAAGLSRAHIDHSLLAVLHPIRPEPARPSPAPTPARREERRERLGPVERDVLSKFRAGSTTRLRVREIFDRGPHANADLVRAFEDLEKQWRYLIRHTTDGVDWIELTVAGAEAIGLPAEPKAELPMELPRPR